MPSKQDLTWVDTSPLAEHAGERLLSDERLREMQSRFDSPSGTWRIERALEEQFGRDVKDAFFGAGRELDAGGTARKGHALVDGERKNLLATEIEGNVRVQESSEPNSLYDRAKVRDQARARSLDRKAANLTQSLEGFTGQRVENLKLGDATRLPGGGVSRNFDATVNGESKSYTAVEVGGQTSIIDRKLGVCPQQAHEMLWRPDTVNTQSPTPAAKAPGWPERQPLSKGSTTHAPARSRGR